MTEAYLGSYQTSMIELFQKNSERLVAVNYFSKKVPSYAFGGVLNGPLNDQFSKSRL